MVDLCEAQTTQSACHGRNAMDESVLQVKGKGRRDDALGRQTTFRRAR